MHFVFTALMLASTETVNCPALYADLYKPSLQLDYTAFDQTENQGFRILAKSACPSEAADLIEAYIAVTGAKQNSLRWHLAQMRAEAGDIKSAITAASESLIDPERDSASNFRWNAYVKAVIAFLQKDRSSFDYHRKIVANDEALHTGNAMNLKFLNKLASSFDKPYAEAITPAARPGPRVPETK